MSRTYAMQDILNTLGSTNKVTVLREYGDFLIAHWFAPASDTYEIAAVIEEPDGKQKNKIMHLSELAMNVCVRQPEKIENLIIALRKKCFKLVPVSEWISRYRNNNEITILIKGKDYIALKRHYAGMDKYYIEAPMYARSPMADSYPLSTEITREQATQFAKNFHLANAYYQKIRYGK